MKSLLENFDLLKIKLYSRKIQMQRGDAFHLAITTFKYDSGKATKLPWQKNKFTHFEHM